MSGEDAALANDPLVRITGRTPQQVCERLTLQPGARKLLDAPITPSQFLTALIQNEWFDDAVSYLANALPKRDAVAWAGACVRLALGATPPKEAVAAVEAAEAWVKEPSEACCRAAEEAAAPPVAATAGASYAAYAAFVSGESIAPAGLPVVEPPEGVTATCVAAAVTLAATSGAAAEIADRYPNYLARGILIARTPLK